MASYSDHIRSFFLIKSLIFRLFLKSVYLYLYNTENIFQTNTYLIDEIDIYILLLEHYPENIILHSMINSIVLTFILFNSDLFPFIFFLDKTKNMAFHFYLTQISFPVCDSQPLIDKRLSIVSLCGASFTMAVFIKNYK